MNVLIGIQGSPGLAAGVMIRGNWVGEILEEALLEEEPYKAQGHLEGPKGLMRPVGAS